MLGAGSAAPTRCSQSRSRSQFFMIENEIRMEIGNEIGTDQMLQNRSSPNLQGKSGQMEKKVVPDLSPDTNQDRDFYTLPNGAKSGQSLR